MIDPAPNTIQLQRLCQLWGKTDREGGTNAFHPAIYHMLDVGYVAQLLLGNEGSLRIRRVLTRAFGTSSADLATWLPLVVALHDIGKISSQFQKMAPEQRQRLLAEGFEFDSRPADQPIAHNILGAAYLQSQLPTFLTRGTLPKGLLLVLRDTIGGHHGRFSPSKELNDVEKHITPRLAGSYTHEPLMWNELRDVACEVLASLLVPTGMRPPISGDALEVNVRAATLMLTGFTILCDWIGSDTRHFPISNHIEFDAYKELSRKRARDAVQGIGSLLFEQTADATRYTGFGTLFPDIKEVRPLQQAVDQLPLAKIGHPTLFIVEAPTGEGKTEFALALVQRLASQLRGQGQSDELYFALPTMATSNQMYLRVSKFIEQVHGGGVELVHGQAYLAREDLARQLNLYSDADRADPAGSSARASQTWFAPKKRALLAPYGVGTVDQAELTTLSTRHYMLRLFGLAGKVLIIDEVHAYDLYMSTILQHVLRWLATLGTSVILLSATLPSGRHRELAEAFQEGLAMACASEGAKGGPSWLEEASENSLNSRDNLSEGQDINTAPLPYPLIAAYGPEQPEPHLHEVEASQKARELHLRFLHLSKGEEIRDFLLEQVAGGGAVCYISNTVQNAQDVFRALNSVKPQGVVLKLIHSRYPLEDRLKLEDEISQLVGPRATRAIGEKIIVVGTQVLEQSLDLDFDVMVSDHAPVDLLLQRAGRLHRHPWRDQQELRPPAHSVPRLYILVPLCGGGEDRIPDFARWTPIYSEYILWRSWLTLQKFGVCDAEHAIVSLSAGYRSLIEDCYTHDIGLEGLSATICEAIESSFVEHRKEERNMIEKARTRLIPEPNVISSIVEGTNINFEEDEDGGKAGWGVAQTRLGDVRIIAIPLYEVDGRWSLDSEGAAMLSPGLKENKELQLAALRRSIPVSHKTLVHYLQRAAGEVPAWFREAPLLRYTAPLVLARDGQAQMGNVVVSLDKVLGLVIMRPDNMEKNDD